jgi:hypothetical protein
MTAELMKITVIVAGVLGLLFGVALLILGYFVRGGGMVPAVIDPESGLLATDWCPNRVREYFKPNALPTEGCNLHNEWTQRGITEAQE